MRLELLEYIIEIDKTHSINAASKNLNITQQNLSKAMKSLENELQVPLLERSPTGVTLTPQGKKVVNKAQYIVGELESLAGELAEPVDVRLNFTGKLHIMYANAFDLHELGSWTNAFCAQYPHVQLTVQQKDLTTVFTSILENRIDIGLISMPTQYQQNQTLWSNSINDLIISPLKEGRFVAAVSKSSPLAKQKSISLSALIKYPLLLLHHGHDEDILKNWMYDMLLPYGKPHFSYITNHSELYLKAIVANTGIGFFSHFDQEDRYSPLMDYMEIFPIRPLVPIFHSYVINRNTPLSPEAQACLALLTI